MNKTKTIIWVVIAIIIIAGIWYETTRKPTEKEPIKIGAILPLTGKAFSLGEGVRNAIDLAVKKVNNKRKIVEVFYEDEKCDPKEAVGAYQSLRLRGIKIIIGAVCSQSTLSITPIAEQERVILITPGSAADKISQAGDFIFRNHTFMSQKGEKIGNFAVQNFHRVATFYDQSSDAYVIGEEAFVKEFQSNEKQIAKREAFQKGSTDFRMQLLKIKEADVDAIYLLALTPDSSLIVKQIEELGITAQILTDDSMVTESAFRDAVGDLSEGIIFSGTEFDRNTNPEFWNSYNEIFSKNPNIFAAQGYDSLMILTKIIFDKECGTDTTCIKNELYKIKDYMGVAGKTTFDENGDAIKPITIKTVKNSQFVPYEE